MLWNCRECAEQKENSAKLMDKLDTYMILNKNQYEIIAISKSKEIERIYLNSIEGILTYIKSKFIVQPDFLKITQIVESITIIDADKDKVNFKVTESIVDRYELHWINGAWE